MEKKFEDCRMKFGPGKSGENCELYGSDSLYRINTKVYDKEPAGAYERVAAADGKPAEGDEDHPCGGNQWKRQCLCLFELHVDEGRI